MADPRLRQATWEDAGFLYRLHRTVLREYVAQTWGTCNEEWQQHRFHQQFDPAAWRVITLAGHDIGALRSEECETELFLSVIEVLPQYQRRGIGTSIICSIMGEAHRSGKPVALQVMKVNPARRLYEGLGFVVCGETETHYQMRAEAPESR